MTAVPTGHELVQRYICLRSDSFLCLSVCQQVVSRAKSWNLENDVATNFSGMGSKRLSDVHERFSRTS